MNSDQVFSAIRGVLLGGGSILGSYGVTVSATQWETIVGAVMVLVSFAWSQIHHAKNPTA